MFNNFFEKPIQVVDSAKKYTKEKLLLATTLFSMTAATSNAQSYPLNYPQGDTQSDVIVDQFGLHINLTKGKLEPPRISDPGVRYEIIQDAVTATDIYSMAFQDQMRLEGDHDFNRGLAALRDSNFLFREIPYGTYKAIFEDQDLFDKILACKDYYRTDATHDYFMCVVRMLSIVSTEDFYNNPDYAEVVYNSLSANNPLACFVVSFGLQDNGVNPLVVLDKDTRVPTRYSEGFLGSIYNHFPDMDRYVEFGMGEFLQSPHADSIFIKDRVLEHTAYLSNTVLSMAINHTSLSPESFKFFNSRVYEYNGIDSSDTKWIFGPDESVYGDGVLVINQDVPTEGLIAVSGGLSIEQILPTGTSFEQVTTSALSESEGTVGSIARSLENTLTTKTRPTIVLRVHGDMDGTAVIGLLDNSTITISPELILEQLLSRYAIDSLKNEPVVFIIESCYGSDFAMKLLDPIIRHNQEFLDDQWMLPAIILGSEFGNISVGIGNLDNELVKSINSNLTNPDFPEEGLDTDARKRTIGTLLGYGGKSLKYRPSVVFVPVEMPQDPSDPDCKTLVWGVLKVE